VGELNPDLILDGVEGLPVLGREILACRCTFTLGSSTALCAANLAALGLRVGIVGKVGEDPFGEFVLRSLGERGIDASRVIRDSTLRTGVTVSLRPSFCNRGCSLAVRTDSRVAIARVSQVGERLRRVDSRASRRQRGVCRPR